MGGTGLSRVGGEALGKQRARFRDRCRRRPMLETNPAPPSAAQDPRAALQCLRSSPSLARVRVLGAKSAEWAQEGISTEVEATAGQVMKLAMPARSCSARRHGVSEASPRFSKRRMIGAETAIEARLANVVDSVRRGGVALVFAFRSRGNWCKCPLCQHHLISGRI